MSIERSETIDGGGATVALVTYAALFSAIVAVYVAVVVVPHVVLGRDGEVGSGFVLPVTATAVVALLFEPTRTRARRMANRLVRGHRAEPYEVLSRLAGTLSEPGAERTGVMAEILGRGAGADQATIWRHTGPSDMLSPIGHWPGDSPAPAARQTVEEGPSLGVRSIAHRGEVLGAVSISKPEPGIAAADERLLADVAASLVLPLRNQRLVVALEERATEVRASRRRLIEAQDRERRLLERNLHDGAQQHLVALSVRLGLASTLAGRDGDGAMTQDLQGLVEVVRSAVDSLRALAHGIYPSLLESSGLQAALSGLAAPEGVAVVMAVNTEERFGQPTEATAYFCVIELVDQAIARGATEVAVTIAPNGSELRISVADDGTEERPRSPVIEDRVDAAGGSMRSVNASGGSHIEIVLPASRQAMTS